MNTSAIVTQRLVSQQISQTAFTRPDQIVGWMGAIQAQEFAMAKWAIGLRLHETKENEVDKAFNDGKILRTHLLRPTWHFVTPADIQWMLELTTPHVHALNAYMYRKSELDPKTLKRCNDLMVKNLEGRKHLTRAALQAEFKKTGIEADGLRLGYIMMQAELDGLICSGPREGKQFTYALLEERITKQPSKTREEALAELTKRYFSSRAPATVNDFAYWSGLSLKDAKTGLALLGKQIVREAINGKEYLRTDILPKAKHKLDSCFLMPDYDEYGMSYKERSALSGTIPYKKGNPMFNRFIVIDGVIEGSWQRLVKGKTSTIDLHPFGPLNKTCQQKADKAAKRFEAFLNPE